MELGSDDDVDGVLKDDGIDAIEEQEDEAAIRAALHFHVGEICSGETSGKPMTGAAVSTLAEVHGPLRVNYALDFTPDDGVMKRYVLLSELVSTILHHITHPVGTET